MKTSTGHILSGVTWTYEGLISIFKGQGYQGIGVSRSMFLKPETIEEIPEELFAIKISQSKKAELAGKPMFKFFSYRIGENAQYTSSAPEEITMATPLAEIKNLVLTKLAPIAGLEISLVIPLKGKFTPVTFADDTFNIYDEDKFPSDDYKQLGEPAYYLKADTPMTVTLKGVLSPHNQEYFQSTLATDMTSFDALQTKGGSGKIWSPDGNHTDAADAVDGAATEGDDNKSLWG